MLWTKLQAFSPNHLEFNSLDFTERLTAREDYSIYQELETNCAGFVPMLRQNINTNLGRKLPAAQQEECSES